MRKLIVRRLAQVALALFALCLPWLAGAEVPVPPLTGHVTDLTATLAADQASALEAKLQAFEARKGSQLAVLLVPTTAPETIEQYALRVAEQWKLGRRKVDDGAILVVAKDDRALRIEVGYGLEGVLSDVVAKRIIAEIIVPRFREGDYAGGIAAGVDRMMGVIDGEALPAPAPGRRNGGGGGIESLQGFIPVILILAFAVGGVLRAVLGRFPGALATGGVVAVVAWFFVGVMATAALAGLIAFVFTLFGGGLLRGGLGGLGGGGGSGGYSGGGGGFGGGGASGKW